MDRVKCLSDAEETNTSDTSSPTGQPKVPSHSPSCQSVVTLHEIVPSHQKLKRTKIWRWDLSHTGHGHGHDSINSHEKSPKNVRKYYKKQEDMMTMLAHTEETNETDEVQSSFAGRAAKLSLACNLVLLIAKVIACYLSGSLAVISSLVDSSIDLVSGVMIWITNRSIKMTNFYEYPVGKTRLEPLAITVMSVIMAIASIQLIIQSVQSLLKGSIDLNVGIITIVIICCTIVTKIFLYFYCRRHQSPSTRVLVQDHRNDIFSNAIALVLGYVGDRFWLPADPLGAILISIYIAYGWFKVGWQQVKDLSGHVASPERLSQLLQVCCTFDDRIEYIDTLRAYHFGCDLIVEAHIVLPPNITLKEAHDIGEPLQQKLTMFSFVERAFVHIDYEYEHRPETEHPIKRNIHI